MWSWELLVVSAHAHWLASEMILDGSRLTKHLPFQQSVLRCELSQGSHRNPFCALDRGQWFTEVEGN